jgi:RHS repeat-associated protein
MSILNSITAKFNTHELDQTGLSYFNARYYDADTGRFITPDPTVPNPSDSQAFNRYSFVCGNPISFVDMNGYEKEEGGTSSVVDKVCEAVKDAANTVSKAISSVTESASNAAKEVADRITSPTQPASNPQQPGVIPVSNPDNPASADDPLSQETNDEAKRNEEKQKKETAKDNKKTALEAIDDAKDAVEEYINAATQLLDSGMVESGSPTETNINKGINGAKEALTTLETSSTKVNSGNKDPKEAKQEADSIKEEYEGLLNDL